MYNPDVAEDAAIVRKSADIKGTLEIVSAAAKAKRLSQ